MTGDLARPRSGLLGDRRLGPCRRRAPGPPPRRLRRRAAPGFKAQAAVASAAPAAAARPRGRRRRPLASPAAEAVGQPKPKKGDSMWFRAVSAEDAPRSAPLQEGRLDRLHAGGGQPQEAGGSRPPSRYPNAAAAGGVPADLRACPTHTRATTRPRRRSPPGWPSRPRSGAAARAAGDGLARGVGPKNRQGSATRTPSASSRCASASGTRASTPATPRSPRAGQVVPRPGRSRQGSPRRRGKPIDDPNSYGEWIADVERPAEQFRCSTRPARGGPGPAQEGPAGARARAARAGAPGRRSRPVRPRHSAAEPSGERKGQGGAPTRSAPLCWRTRTSCWTPTRRRTCGRAPSTRACSRCSTSSPRSKDRAVGDQDRPRPVHLRRLGVQPLRRPRHRHRARRRRDRQPGQAPPHASRDRDRCAERRICARPRSGTPWAIAVSGFFTDGGHQDHLQVAADGEPPADFAARAAEASAAPAAGGGAAPPCRAPVARRPRCRAARGPPRSLEPPSRG